MPNIYNKISDLNLKAMKQFTSKKPNNENYNNVNQLS